MKTTVKENLFIEDTLCIINRSKKRGYLAHRIDGVNNRIFLYARKGVSDNKIKNYLQEIRQKAKNQGDLLIIKEGEIFRFLGKNYVIRLLIGDKYNLILLENNALFTVPANFVDATARAYLIKFYKKALDGYIKKRLPIFEEETGLKFLGYRIINNRSFWGECDYINKKLTMSLKIVRENEEFIDYVLIHETCHLSIQNHSKDFYKLVSKFCPNYKLIKKGK